MQDDAVALAQSLRDLDVDPAAVADLDPAQVGSIAVDDVGRPVAAITKQRARGDAEDITAPDDDARVDPVSVADVRRAVEADDHVHALLLDTERGHPGEGAGLDG